MPGSPPKSPPQKKRPVVDAFSELTSPKKRAKTTNTTTNAFEEMMQSAKKPGAFCSVSNASIMEYLEENPCLRETLGEFIFSERQIADEKAAAVQQDDDDGREEPDEEENNSVVRENMEGLERYVYVDYDSDPDEYGEGSEHCRLVQVWQVEKLREPVPNSSLQVHTNDRLPPPPSTPSLDAALIAVRVHFDTHRYEDCIKGFTMIYDDNVEIPIGRVSTTEVAEIVLNKGEHIIGVQAHHHNSRPYFMEYIGFRTTQQDRWLTAKGGEVVSDWRWEEHSWTKDRNKQKRFPPGMVLRSIEFDPEQLPPMSDLITVPIDNLKVSNGETDSKPEVPSLQTLIQDQTDAHFKEKASTTCQSILEELAGLKENAEAGLVTEKERLQCKLQRSPEATFIRFLDRLRDRIARRLERKSGRLQHHLKLRQAKVNADFEMRKIDAKERCQEEHREIYTRHLAFHETNARMSAKHKDVDVEGSNERLCIFPQCRRPFYPDKLPLAKRCTVEGCTSAYQTCGCLMDVCSICDIRTCPWHADDHFKSCQESAPQKCGYATTFVSEGPFLMPGFCQRSVRSLRKCFYCETQCCRSCGDTCSCGEFWCKACLHPTNPPGEACCDNPDFHPGCYGGLSWGSDSD